MTFERWKEFERGRYKWRENFTHRKMIGADVGMRQKLHRQRNQAWSLAQGF